MTINRLEACKIANVEPRFAKLPVGSDPLAFIASANLMRRNLTKGQQAMALAMIYPESENGGRGKSSRARKAVLNTGFSIERLRQARSVLHYSRPLAEAVLKNTIPLNDALAKVQQEQQYQQSDEAKLARLRESAPDQTHRVGRSKSLRGRPANHIASRLRKFWTFTGGGSNVLVGVTSSKQRNGGNANGNATES